MVSIQMSFMIADKLKDDLLSEGFCLWISKSLVADWATRYYPGDETGYFTLKTGLCKYSENTPASRRCKVV